MSKRFILFMAIIGGAVGGYVPVLLGDVELLDGWSILGSTVGGIVGIWLGVVISKRYGV